MVEHHDQNDVTGAEAERPTNRHALKIINHRQNWAYLIRRDKTAARSLHKLLIAAVASLCFTPAFGQWQTPTHSVPIGKGAGVTGFNSVGPCLTGIPIVGAGVSADPACSAAARLYSAITAPASPSVGFGAAYLDSTNLVFSFKNAAGTISNTVVPDTGAASNYISAISAAGVITKSRPSCATLSDSGTGCSATIGSYMPLAGGTFTGGIGFSTTNTLDIGTSATVLAPRTVYAGTSFVGPLGNFTTSATIGAGSAITSSGAGGALGTNAFNSTAYLPLTGGTLTGGLTVNPTAGDALTATTVSGLNKGFNITQVGSGSGASGLNLNQINITNDTADAGVGFLQGVGIVYGFGGSAMKGGRIGLNIISSLNAATSATNSNRFYIAGEFIAQAQADDGGGAGTEQGYLYAVNPYVKMTSAAAYFNTAAGGEVDTDIQTGASVKNKYGWVIAQVATDKVAGSTDDAALFFANQTGAVGWGTLIQIGNGVGANPLKATGTILSLSGSPTIGSGIDLTGAGTITNYAFKSNAFSVNGSGLLASADHTITSASATALAVGRLGATTPALLVDASTATSITGIKIKSAASTGGVAISAIGEAANGNLTIDAQGSGTISLNATGTGNITTPRVTTFTNTTDVTPGSFTGALQVFGGLSLVKSLGVGVGLSTADATVGIGKGRTGDGNSYLEMSAHNAPTYGYDARWIRFAGVNGAQTFYNAGTGDFGFFQIDAGAISFGTSNAEKVRIIASGCLAIGTTTDCGLGSLQVNAKIYAPNLATTTAALAAAVCWTATTGEFQLDTNAGGCLVSAARYKHNIKSLPSMRRVVLAMHPVSFDYNDDIGIKGNQVGFVADEMASVERRLVGFNDDGLAQSVRYMQATAVLTKAMQETINDVDEIKVKLRVLKADNDNLRQEFEQTKQRVSR